MTTESTNAALLIIGNEVLSGRTQDANTAFIGDALAARGIALAEVRIVRDKTRAIVDAVNALRKAYDYVVTTGGIGPTHDDITTASVAAAFGIEVERNPAAEKLLMDYYGPERISQARLKMADVPVGASLIENPATVAPGFRVDNVFVLAGVPRIMQSMLPFVMDQMQGGAPIISRTVTAWSPESEIAAVMESVEREQNGVEVGSYPFVRGERFGTSVVLRSADAVALDQATSSLLAALDNAGVSHE